MWRENGRLGWCWCYDFGWFLWLLELRLINPFVWARHENSIATLPAAMCWMCVYTLTVYCGMDDWFSCRYSLIRDTTERRWCVMLWFMSRRWIPTILLWLWQADGHICLANIPDYADNFGETVLNALTKHITLTHTKNVTIYWKLHTAIRSLLKN